MGLIILILVIAAGYAAWRQYTWMRLRRDDFPITDRHIKKFGPGAWGGGPPMI